jgi:hypothetical protein
MLFATMLLTVAGCRRSAPAVAAAPDPPEFDVSSQPAEIRQAAECARGVLRKEKLMGDNPLLTQVAAFPGDRWTARFVARGGERGMVDATVSLSPCTSQRVLVHQ